jgi:hypothetical protein
MKKIILFSFLLSTIILLAACTQTFDPLAPGLTEGQFAAGIKALVPLAIGNTWEYNVVLYDTSGAERTRYGYTLSVVDTVRADTSLIPLSSSAKQGMKREALLWYLLQGERGVRTCWQIDTLENLRMRKTDDTRFFEQIAFDFRAETGAVTPLRYIGADTVLWASGDIVISNPDSVRSKLVTKVDTLRTTLGSAPYFKYWQSFSIRKDSITYYFKPGFGLVAYEKFQRKSNGTMVRVRRDELASYYFK